jgi:hypothetical protein
MTPPCETLGRGEHEQGAVGGATRARRVKAKAVERLVRTGTTELPFRVDRAEPRSRRREEK